MVGAAGPAPNVPREKGPVGDAGVAVRLFFRILRANVLSLVGFVLVVVLVVLAVAVAIDPGFLPNSPSPWTTGNPSQAPSARYPFGTDNLGRNMLSLVVAALPTDLAIALGVSFAALLLGGGLGLVAGFWDKPGTAWGYLSAVILRVTDIFLAFPSLVLALTVATVLQRGVAQTALAILFTWWPFYVRLTRGEVLAVKHLPYVTAARAAGVPERRIVLRHVVRNILDPLVVYFTLDIGTVIVVLSTISYIGVGVPPLIPEWGNMFKQYQDLFLALPWTLLAPGFMVFVTVLAFSLLGDGLRDVLDPRSRRILVQVGVLSQIKAEGGVPLAPSLPAEGESGATPAPQVTA